MYEFLSIKQQCLQSYLPHVRIKQRHSRPQTLLLHALLNRRKGLKHPSVRVALSRTLRRPRRQRDRILTPILWQYEAEMALDDARAAPIGPDRIMQAIVQRLDNLIRELQSILSYPFYDEQ